ncbi:DNA polymerase III subunit alpha [Rhodovarius crocodyli]|uniref:Error-prone DNA polymerase n=1 Tax=Rhodovarius crocodyli TaxID=1979269 RepID=A0A437MNC9_9PROT|nr:error-prone DNA polymerase [Rhodovarius crocodyli]RVT99120.1 DNA polymerase III subunit alpha [Rhodovarius crocodyli]
MHLRLVHPLPAYAEVAARSNFSFLDGASHPEELAARAAELEHAGFGLCDTNGLAGVVRGHLAAKARGLSFATGCRFRLEDETEWLAWPTDRTSYGRLTALLSTARMNAPKGEERISFDAMLAAAEGWVLAAIPPDRPGGSDLSALCRAASARLALPVMVATSCPRLGEDGPRLARHAALAEAAGAWLLATNNVRYHHPSRAALADVLSAIRLHRTIDTLGTAAEPNAERHLKSPAEMLELFGRYPRALANTIRIIDATRGFSLDQLRYEYPEETLDPGRTAQETLEARVAAAVAEKWPAGAPEEIADRLSHEMELIGRLGYAPYFLTVHEIVLFARHKEILCQGRGSAANSTVCYVLGITAVDPARHKLLFERFISASRNEPPDIDIDFEHERREEVIQHLYERYGRDRAAICATLIRYRSRSAIREVSKALGIGEEVAARLSKASWGPGRDTELSDLAAQAGFDLREQRLALMVQMTEELIDFPRHTATHVGGFVITRGPLVELAVVGNATMDDRTVLEWDKDDIEALGMLKVDVLGLGMLSCLRRAFDLMWQHHRHPLGLRSLPPECPQTYAMLRRADAIGVFQVESRAQMNMLPRLRPEKFYDLVIEVAIVRPGPIQGGMVHPYLRRRQGLEEPQYPEPSPEFGPKDELRDVLEDTLGVPLFQEQAMKLAIAAAKFTPEEADQLRRAMATFKNRGTIELYREKLVGGMVRRGYVREFAERVFSQIEGFGSYGFPESHAASFALLVYASAWLKCHYPAVFACALLNSQPMGFYAPAQIIRDVQEHDVTVLPIDVNASDWDCTLEREGAALRLGMRLVKSLKPGDAKRISDARQSRNGAPFDSVEELAWRTGLDADAIEALAAADAFPGTPRRRAIWDARGSAGSPLRLPLFASQREEAALGMAGEHPLMAEPLSHLPEEAEGEAILTDYSVTGLSLRRHPMALLRPHVSAHGCIPTTALRKGRARVAGLVLMRQRPGSSNGVIFVTLEDEAGTANLVVFPDVAERHHDVLTGSRLLIAEGKVERLEERVEKPITHLIVHRLVDGTGLLERLSDGAMPERQRTLTGSMPASRDFR